MSSNRYYDNQKEEIKPGKISNKLREALNLADNDIPIWIYRMRAIGYPPGWLSKAIIDNDIFEADGNQDAKIKRNEDIQYDHSKLIEYPGFNMPLPAGTNDYHYYYNMPPMLAHQQLEHAKKFMNSVKSTPVGKPSSNDEAQDATPDDAQDATHDDAQDSSALDDVKYTVPDEIQDPASPDADKTNGGCDSEPNTDLANSEPAKDEISNSSDKLTADVDKASNCKLNHSNPILEEIKLVSKGSPMPKNVKRPPLERFSDGVVGDLLYFENTPSSSGKFASIRGLLNTMRCRNKRRGLDST